MDRTGAFLGEMKLDLRFTARPLRALYCEAVATLVFDQDTQTWATDEGLDRKTRDILLGLRSRGFWKACPGETLLLASEDRIKARKILLKGLGPPEGCGMDDLLRGVYEMGRALKRLRVHDFGIRVPLLPGSEDSYPRLVRDSCLGLADIFSDPSTPDFLLKILFSVDESLMGGLRNSLASMGEDLSPPWTCTVIMD